MTVQTNIEKTIVTARFQHALDASTDIVVDLARYHRVTVTEEVCAAIRGILVAAASDVAYAVFEGNPAYPDRTAQDWFRNFSAEVFGLVGAKVTEVRRRSLDALVRLGVKSHVNLLLAVQRVLSTVAHVAALHALGIDPNTLTEWPLNAGMVVDPGAGLGGMVN